MNAFTAGFNDELQKAAKLYFRPSLKSLLAGGLIGGGLLSLRGRSERKDAKKLVPGPAKKAPRL